MATRRFCDLCDKQLTFANTGPFVRELEYNEPDSIVRKKAVAYIEITNEHNHPLTDVCLGCRLKVATDGTPCVKPPKPSAIATLQPEVAADQASPVRLYQSPSALLPTTPPKADQTQPPPAFVPSLTPETT